MFRCPKCKAILVTVGGTGNKEIDDNLPIRCSCGYRNDVITIPVLPLIGMPKQVIQNDAQNSNYSSAKMDADKWNSR